MATTYKKINVLAENDSYIESPQGHIPALLVETDKGVKMLFVVVGASEFSFASKSIKWQIVQFTWNIITKKWDVFDTNLWNNNEMWVSTHTKVNAQGKPTTDELAVTTEADFYINSLGKQAIFPAIQGAIELKLKPVLDI